MVVELMSLEYDSPYNQDDIVVDSHQSPFLEYFLNESDVGIHKLGIGVQVVFIEHITQNGEELQYLRIHFTSTGVGLYHVPYEPQWSSLVRLHVNILD